MADDVIRIEALENGFEVECLDPKIDAENSKGKGYQDPYKGYAFSTAEEVIKFITERLKTMKPDKDGGFAKSFKEAAAKS